MGKDKASLTLGGETFPARILRSFPDAEKRIVSAAAEVTECVSGQPGRTAEVPFNVGTEAEFVTVRDRIPDFGPLGGLQAALRVCDSEYVFVTACDQPFMEERFACRLLFWLPEGFDAAVPVTRDGRIHPLSALYRTEVLRKAADALIAEGDHRARRLAEGMRTMYVPADALPGGARCLRNVNTPEEYAELCAEDAGAGKNEPLYENTPSGIPVFALSAYSGTGKTTFLEHLIPELKRQRPGLRVGVVKHDVHGFTVDQEGKDTRRLAEAGADITAILNDARAAVMEYRPRSVYEILEGLSELDIIFLEGFKKEPFRKILLYRKASGRPPAADPAECFLVIADDARGLWPEKGDAVRRGDACPVRPDFRPDEIPEIASALLKEAGVDFSCTSGYDTGTATQGCII